MTWTFASVRSTLTVIDTYNNNNNQDKTEFSVSQTEFGHKAVSFTSIKHLHEIPTGSPPASALNRGGV